jgi:hypothetical protein
LTVIDLIEKGPRLLSLANYLYFILEKGIYYIGIVTLAGILALAFSWGVTLLLFPLDWVKIRIYSWQFTAYNLVFSIVFFAIFPFILYMIWMEGIESLYDTPEDKWFYLPLVYLLGLGVTIISVHDSYNYIANKLKLLEANENE